jgi:hypothetical protein
MMTSGVPKVNGETRVVISHTEYIGTFRAAELFSCDAFAINPGNTSLFPWLSHIAHNYEEYKFHSLKFDYSPAVSSSTVGTLMMAVDYDCLDSVPTSKIGFLQNHKSVRGNVWSPMTCICDKQTLASRPPLKVRSGSSAVGDLRLSNLGNFLTASNSVVIQSPGDLEITYVIEFFIPQYNISDEAFDASAKITGVGTSRNDPLPKASVITGGIPLVMNLDNVITFKEAGEYLLSFDVIGTAITAAAALAPYVADGSVASLVTFVVNAAGTAATFRYKYRNLNPGASALIGYANCATLTTMLVSIADFAYSL